MDNSSFLFILQIIGVSIVGALLVNIPRVLWVFVFSSDARYERREKRAAKCAREFNAAMREIMQNPEGNYRSYETIPIDGDAELRLRRNHHGYGNGVVLQIASLLPLEPDYSKWVYTLTLDEIDFAKTKASPREVAERFARLIRLYRDLPEATIAQVVEQARERREAFTDGTSYMYWPDQVRAQREALGLAQL